VEDDEITHHAARGLAVNLNIEEHLVGDLRLLQAGRGWAVVHELRPTALRGDS
jgi:hypothetical protein